ncbi:class I SAM-dependent methyltransferase [Actinokineospora sp. NPDC004072]
MDWDWGDPAGLARRMDAFTETLARCDKLDDLGALPPSRAGLADLGVTGVEFAAFRTAHPTGLGSDLVGLSCPTGATEPGRVYRVDGAALFTQLDICAPLPIEDGALDWVYAEHLIEHVPLAEGIGWLREVRRVLAPGGLLRLTTPDLAAYIAGYSGGGFYAKHRRRVRLALGEVAPPMPTRRAFMVNQIFYLYGHRWIYDYDELAHALTQAGFTDFTMRAYREGARSDVAALDQTIRNDETIYVEATA